MHFSINWSLGALDCKPKTCLETGILRFALSYMEWVHAPKLSCNQTRSETSYFCKSFWRKINEMHLRRALESISLLYFVKQQLYYQNLMTTRHTIFGKKLYMTYINTFMLSILFCDPQFDRTFTCHYDFPLLIWDAWTKKRTFGILTHLFNNSSVSGRNNDVKSFSYRIRNKSKISGNVWS